MAGSAVPGPAWIRTLSSVARSRAQPQQCPKDNGAAQSFALQAYLTPNMA